MPHTLKEKITWIHYPNPSAGDLVAIRAGHDFHPVILNELLGPSAYSRADRYDGYIFFSYHLPLYEETSKTSIKSEVDFLITSDTVITVSYRPLVFIDEFTSELEHNAELRTLVLGESTGMFTYYLLQKINSYCLRQLKHVEDNITAINEKIFSNQEHLLLQQISYAKRDILNYCMIAEPQETALHSLKEVGVAFWGEPMKMYLTDLINDHAKSSRQIKNFRSTIESLEETNSQLLNSKTNSVMQRFTILAFLTFPLALFATIYNIPEVNAVMIFLFGNFWRSFLVMMLVTIGVLVMFIKKEWF